MGRMINTSVWEEDWFVDLPEHYKLFYLFIYSKCDHAGIWRKNKSQFRLVSSKIPMFDDFLSAVNRDDQGQATQKRIIVLDNGRWFLPGFIAEQCGSLFKIEIGAHRGMLKLLLQNGIYPKDVPNFQWGKILDLDFQDLIKLAHGRALYSLSMEGTKGMHRPMEKEKEKELKKESLTQGLEHIEPDVRARELPDFPLKSIYLMPWDTVKGIPGFIRSNDSQLNEDTFLWWKEFIDATIERGAINILQHAEFVTPRLFLTGNTRDIFKQWLEFVDYVRNHNFTELFNCKFISPVGLQEIVSKGFNKKHWQPTLKKILATGIKPEQNLFYRIPQFLNGQSSKFQAPNAGMDAGVGGYEGQQSW